MKPAFPHPTTLVQHGALLRLQGTPGQRVACVRGILWITQQDDPRDWILVAGESLSLDRTGTVLVNALGECAALAHERVIRPQSMRTPVAGANAATPSIVAAIDGIRPRYKVTTAAGAAVAPQRTMVEAEARWMRSQVAALLLARVGAAIASLVERVIVRPVAALAESIASYATKRRGTEAR